MSEEQEEMVAEDIEEQRSHPRFRINMSVFVRLSSGELVRAQGKNISKTGLYIEYGAAADVGNEFEMMFDVPLVDGMPRIYVRARVMRTTLIGDRDVYGMGFQFLNFSKDSEVSLDKYLDLRESKQGGSF